MRPIGTAKELERRRRRAVLLVKQGEKPALVARILGVARSTIYAWLKLDRQEGPQSLASKSHAGPKPRLTDEQLRELEALLLRRGNQGGSGSLSWSPAEVAELIRLHFGVEYHVEHVRKILRRRLNVPVRAPNRRPRARRREAR